MVGQNVGESVDSKIQDCSRMGLEFIVPDLSRSLVDLKDLLKLGDFAL